MILVDIDISYNTYLLGYIFKRMGERIIHEERAPSLFEGEENDNIFTGTVLEQLYVPGLVYNNRRNNINVVSEPPSNKDNSKAAALQFVKQQLLLNGDESNNSTVNNLDTFTFDGIGEQNPCGEEEATYNDDSLMWMEDMDTSSSDESATLSPFLSSNASSMLTGASLFDFAVDRDLVPNSKSSVANNTSNSNNNKLPSTFTDEENNIINDGVDNEWSWEDIASKCNNKTAKQCSQQWRKIVKTVSVHEVPWTKEEDGIIRKGVEEGMSWQNIAKLTKRRLSRQCSQRWRKVLDPSIKRFVKWSKEEDLKLMELHRNYPTMTNKEMSSHLPGRTSTQCHNRWVEVLNPDLRRGVFSEEEDLRILELRKAGQGWSAMAKDSILIGRANVALKNRWHTLTKRNKNAQKRKVKAKASRKSEIKKTQNTKIKKRKRNIKGSVTVDDIINNIDSSINEDPVTQFMEMSYIASTTTPKGTKGNKKQKLISKYDNNTNNNNNNNSNSNNNKLPSTFTDEENNIINDGVDNEWSWEDIASKCNNKTAKQCSQQWRKIVKTVSVHEVPWTKEEDGIIRKGVEEGMSWQNIAKLTKRRLSRQCSQRWRKVLDPSIKRFVKWSKEEDLKLMELHRNYPTMTNKEMSSHLPGRTSTQCHNRWVEVLNPDLRRGVFSEEEDLRILELRKAGQGWSAMAKDSILIGRANVALKNRWHTLTKRNKNAQKRKVKNCA